MVTAERSSESSNGPSALDPSRPSTQSSRRHLPSCSSRPLQSIDSRDYDEDLRSSINTDTLGAMHKLEREIER